MVLSVTWQEEHPSRGFDFTRDSASQKFNFFVCGNFYEEATIDPILGPQDDLQVLEAVYDFVPIYRSFATYTGEISTLRIDQVTIEQVLHDKWRVQCVYSLSPENVGEQGDPNKGDYQQWTQNFVQLGFNVASQQENVKMSLATFACQKAFGVGGAVPYPAFKPAPIGLTTDGAEGTSVYKRLFSFNITSYFQPKQLDFQYVRRLFRIATTLNAKTFLGFPRGSVLFLEASGSGDVYSEVPVTFDFQVQPNFKFSQTEAEKLMDPGENDPDKMFDLYHDPWFPDAPTDPLAGPYSGWDVVDYLYETQNVNNAGLMVQAPTLRTIHRVYSISDFIHLNI